MGAGYLGQQPPVALSLLESHGRYLVGVGPGFNKLLTDLSDFSLGSGHDNLPQGLHKL
ncbi:MAG: hypothetical protein ACK56F_03345 [bacterium]